MLSKTKEMVQTLQNGGVVLMPTDTVYGLAALPTQEKAVQKVYTLKNRPKEMFLPIMVANVHDLACLGLDINLYVRRLLASDLVPGAVTLVIGFHHDSVKPDWLKTREEVAIRIPDHKLVLSVLKETGPLLVTSANKHGLPVTQAKVKDILTELNGIPDLIVEEGEGKEVPSTIINCRYIPPVIERNGLIPFEVINHILNP